MPRITLTDTDGIRFRLEIAMIEAIWQLSQGCYVKVFDGGQLKVKEDLEQICRKVVKARHDYSLRESSGNCAET